MRILNDGAACYSGMTERVTMRHNLVYGIRPKAGHRLRIAYYLDELTRDWVVEQNVALDCNFPNHNHMCGDHLYKENIFVNIFVYLIIVLIISDFYFECSLKNDF